MGWTLAGLSLVLIVAVHGLGADPEHTWEGVDLEDKHTRVHLLRGLLPKDFPNARILSYKHNADWLFDSPTQSTDDVSQRLMRHLGEQRNRSGSNLPIIFIGHSFGGLVIKKAPFFTSLFGSDTGLLLYTRKHGTQLSDLEVEFRRALEPHHGRIKKLALYIESVLIIFQIVDMDSAFGNALEIIGMNTNHSGLNKFHGPKDARYGELKYAIDKLQTPAWVDRAYTLVCKKRYNPEKLKIERISKHELDMDQCYINLAIVEQERENGVHSKDRSGDGAWSSLYSIRSRLKVETPDKNLQIKLTTIFDSRRNTQPPKRILIHGRPGVGKTTLCKKIDLFARVFWIPLRELKKTGHTNDDLKRIFSQLYFKNEPSIDALAESMCDATRPSDRQQDSLFILDGLNEVSDLLDESHAASESLSLLLNSPNSLAKLTFDLKLETVVKDAATIRKIETVVRIPIQLDALCYVWDDEFALDRNSGTMTAIYEAIEKQNQAMAPIVEFLQCLAFNGMHNNVIEFQPDDQDTIMRNLPITSGHGSLDYWLDKFAVEDVSFLRTSNPPDPSAPKSERTYHFLHLTYQEYFAAAYFVRQWRNRKKLKCIRFKESNQSEMSPDDFLKQNKYDQRYGIVWRFTVGLLKDKEAGDFYTAIEQTPLDLVGPTHQRLVMHCLSETISRELRLNLEDRLSQWLRFQCDLARFPLLAARGSEPGVSRLLVADTDFPDRALLTALQESSHSQTLKIIESLKSSGRFLSKEIISCLEKLLTHTDVVVKFTAIGALGKQTNLPDRTVASLILLLEDPSPYFAYEATQAIGNQSSLSEDAIASLVGLYQTSATTGGLENKQSLPEEAAPIPVALPNDEDYKKGNAIQYYAATEALDNQSSLSGTCITISVKPVEFADKRIKYHAATIVAKQSNVSEQIATSFVTLFQGAGDAPARFMALETLRGQSNLPKTTVKALVQLLKNAHLRVRETAAKILACQSSLPEEAKTALNTLAGKSSSSIQYTAAIALKQEATLIQLLQDDNPMFRDNATKVLEIQSNLSEQSRATLIQLLQDDDPKFRGNAAKILETQLNLSTEIIEILMQLIQHNNPKFRDHAAKILETQPNLSIKTIETLIDAYGRVQNMIAKALEEEEGYLHESAIESFTKMLEKGSDNQQRVAAVALRGQSSLQGSSITALMTMLKSKNTVARLEAARTLSKQQKLSNEAGIALVSLLKDPSSLIYIDIMTILEERSSWPRNITENLVPLLADADLWVPSRASRVLGMQSNLPEEVAISIVKLLRDESRHVRCTVAEAIGTEPILMDKILEALGIFSGSGVSAGDQFGPRSNKDSRLSFHQPHKPQDTIHIMESLYGSFLIRSFTEQFWMQINEDSTLSFHYPNGSRTTCLRLQSSDEVLKWRQYWNVGGYAL
ncbi:ARM repeat-containing protein [Nemania serpens]|nr:ARM repeat-containing protein [Nemania serpens]